MAYRHWLALSGLFALATACADDSAGAVSAGGTGGSSSESDGDTGVAETAAEDDVLDETGDPDAFVEAYRAKYGSEPDLYAAHGYDAFKMLAESLLQAGVRGGNDIWKGLRAIREFRGATGDLQFDEKGDVQKFPRVYQVNAEGGLDNYEAEVERRRREILQQIQQLKNEQLRTNDG